MGENQSFETRHRALSRDLKIGLQIQKNHRRANTVVVQSENLKNDEKSICNTIKL